MKNPSSREAERTDQSGDGGGRGYSWSDIVAFCLAMYRVLLPQLLITLLVALVVVFILFFVWFQ